MHFGFMNAGPYQAVALLLIALGVGYLVGLKAQDQEPCCRRFGKVISWCILILSILALGCLAYRTVKHCCGTGEYCPRMPHMALPETSPPPALK